MSDDPIRAFRDAIFQPQAPGVCVTCHQPVLGFRDAVSAREHGISQMCQHCQDGTFPDIEPIFFELGLDLDEPPEEALLLELAQSPDTDAVQARWIAAELHAKAYAVDA